MSVRYIKACLIQDVACLRNRIISQVICKREQMAAHVSFPDDSYYIQRNMMELENTIQKIMTDYMDLEDDNAKTN